MSLISKFATVGGATMASRVLGFVREALIGAALGAGPVADAFYAAFAFPNLFRRIFAEGAFNSAFIPLFAKRLEDSEDAARSFAEEVLSILVAVLILLSVLAILAMPVLVAGIVAPRFVDIPEKFDLTVLMTRIMFPYLFCMSLVAMLSGILNSLRHYFLAAFVPVLLNVILVAAVAIAMVLQLDERSIGLWLAGGVLVSGFAQLALLFRGAARQGFALKIRRPRMTPAVKRLLILMGPAVLTGGVLQINLLVGRIIASAQDGAIALLNYADRINQLPLGVIGIAIGVVLLPELSRALKAGDAAEATHLQNRSLEFALALTLPAAIGFLIIPDAIVNLLYERGAFVAETTSLAAAALAAYASGLPAYVMIKVFQPAYFAREDMKTPFYFSLVMVAVNIAASLALFPHYGHVGIAAATAISAWINVALLAAHLAWLGNFRPGAQSLRRLAVILVASLAMGGLLHAGETHAAFLLDSPHFMARFTGTAGLIGLAVIVYFTLVIAAGGIEREQVMRILRRRK